MSEEQGEFKRPAVFFDRDGTLMEEVDFCADPALVRAFPGVKECLVRLREQGFLRIIVTNQSGIGRGRFSIDDFNAVQAELLRQLDGEIDATYFAPDHPDEATPRRKPGIGMLMEAASEWGIDLSRSVLVGDKAIDVECGHNAGMPAVQVVTGYGAKQQSPLATFVAPGVPEATEWILANVGSTRST